MRFKPTFWPTLITLPMLAVLTGLGVWQLDRLEWKTTQIAERQARATGPAIALPNNRQLPLQDLIYRPARVTGRYMHEAEMYLMSRVRDGTPGVHVITPLVRSDNGGVLMVDRGWAPFNWPDTRAKFHAPEAAEVTVTGIIRPVEAPGWLVPENRPDRNEWYFIDPTAMAETASVLPFTEYYLYATEEIPSGDSTSTSVDGPKYPISNEWRVDLPNDHLSYAITWFALAIVLLAIYLAYHARREQEP